MIAVSVAQLAVGWAALSVAIVAALYIAGHRSPRRDENAELER